LNQFRREVTQISAFGMGRWRRRWGTTHFQAEARADSCDDALPGAQSIEKTFVAKLHDDIDRLCV
jgi:hypothetical protein